MHWIGLDEIIRYNITSDDTRQDLMKWDKIRSDPLPSPWREQGSAQGVGVGVGRTCSVMLVYKENKATH